MGVHDGRQNPMVGPPAVPVTIDEVIQEYTLNTEQARAFGLIAEHSLRKPDSPLRMFLGGPV
ncbi:hypothetical protein B0H11DRAFT_1727508 [Mycena galericulata]|nr:hypothetical protein B0H11DRAFT_1727508 [Mycena galericulata]